MNFGDQKLLKLERKFERYLPVVKKVCSQNPENLILVWALIDCPAPKLATENQKRVWKSLTSNSNFQTTSWGRSNKENLQSEIGKKLFVVGFPKAFNFVSKSWVGF